MVTNNEVLKSIQSSSGGISLSELQDQHPDIARRTLQRQVAKLIKASAIVAHGEGRARRYFGSDVSEQASDTFPIYIPLSADSRDILTYINQPLVARKPVGYQRDLLDDYQPNRTAYLSESLRRQLHKMGKTTEIDEPAGTYSRAILNRLLIDLSWASSHLEGNTYSMRIRGHREHPLARIMNTYSYPS